MTVEILAATTPGQMRVVARDGREVLAYAIWRPGAPDGVGDIHCGRVIARTPAMAGAFVALADAEGFLPDSRGGATVTAGQYLTVRITRAAQGGKGPRLAAVPDEPTWDSPRLIRRGPTALERLAARFPDAPIRLDDPATAPSGLADRIQITRDVFDEDLETCLADFAAPECTLPGGARLHVSPTPALTALDVDLGALTSGRTPKASAQFAANVALLPAIVRHIAIRDLGGVILIDFAGLPVRRRVELRGPLEAALKADAGNPSCAGFTALGLAEIVRPRIHPPLHEMLRGPHAQGLAALAECERATLATPGRSPKLVATPAIVAALERDTAARADFRRRTGHAIELVADPGLGAAQVFWRCA